MELKKQDIGAWVKYPENKPAMPTEVFVKYGTDDKVVGDLMLLQDLYENGWENIEWLKPIEQVYVLTEDKLEKILSKFMDTNVRLYLNGKIEKNSKQFLQSITKS